MSELASEPLTRRVHSGRAGLVSLFAADFVSTLGTWLSIVAMPWLVLINTGSAAKMGLIAVAEWAPLLFTSVLSPPLVDRLGLKLTSVVTDVGSALAIGAIAAAPRLGFAPLVALVAVAGFLRGGGDRAKNVLLRPMAKGAGVQMVRATGVYETMNRMAQLIGAPMAGLLIFWFGTRTAIWLDAVSFLLCGLLVAALVHPNEADASRAGPAQTYLAALRAGARHLFADRLLVSMTAAMFLLNVFSHAGIAVFIPLWVSDVLRSPAGLGLVLGGYAVGAVLGSLLFTALAPRLPPFTTFAVGVLIAGAPRLLVLGLSERLAVVLVVSFGCGMAACAGAPILSALLFERVPAALQTRVFGLVVGICIAGFPIGGLLGGLAVTAFGLRTAILVAAFSCLALTLACLEWCRRGRVQDPVSLSSAAQPT
jgi:MFS family permease